MKNINEIFEEIVGTSVSTKKATRVVNNVEYFFSKWSQSWHPVSEKSGNHNYTKEEVNIWSKVYRAVSQQRATVAELKLAGKEAEAKALEAKLDELWKAKDNSPELYKEVRGLTTDELDALEKDIKVSKKRA